VNSKGEIDEMITSLVDKNGKKLDLCEEETLTIRFELREI